MASINKVIIVGNLGRDPETRHLPSGEAITHVALATSDRWKDKSSGEQREATEWHRVTFFGKLGEIAEQYLRKGSQVYVEGKLRTRKYMDKDGVERSATEIIADQMQMLGGRNEDQPQQAAPSPNSNKKPPARQSSAFDDDIPF